jgi:hypothetical protein
VVSGVEPRPSIALPRLRPFEVAADGHERYRARSEVGRPDEVQQPLDLRIHTRHLDIEAPLLLTSRHLEPREPGVDLLPDDVGQLGSQEYTLQFRSRDGYQNVSISDNYVCRSHCPA